MAVMPSDAGYRVRPLTREDYDVLVASGRYDDVHVELLDGELIEMAPQAPEHMNYLSRLGRALQRHLDAAAPDAYLVRPQGPLATGNLWVPEPDLAVVDDNASVMSTHPVTAHLVVEIAKTSHSIDLIRKPPNYAAAAVTRYWVVDIPARLVVVHVEPYPATDAAPAGYGTIRRLPLDTSLELLGTMFRISDALTA